MNKFTPAQLETMFTELTRLLVGRRGATAPDEICVFVPWGPHQARIWIRYLSDHRFVVSGGWPGGDTAERRSQVFTPRDVLRYQEENPYSEITISADKSPVKIVAEIERRFKPGYVTMLNRCNEAVKMAGEYLVLTNTTAASLAEILGTTARGGVNGIHDPMQNRISLGHLGDKVYGEATVHGDRCEFHIRNMDAESAKALARVLKGLL